MDMKNIANLKVLLALVVSLTIVSCSRKSSSNNVARATGWKINDKNGGFQYNDKFQEQEKAVLKKA